jgi:uncharacterized protein YcfJ
MHYSVGVTDNMAKQDAAFGAMLCNESGEERIMLKKLLGAVAITALPLIGHATEYVTVERPRQECWNEQVATRSSDYGGAIIGGVAGGILGNQVGGGNGKTVATAVGAATGAVVGDRMSGSSTQTVQRCRTVVEHQRVPVAERVYYIEEHHHDHGKHWKHKHKHKHDHDD